MAWGIVGRPDRGINGMVPVGTSGAAGKHDMGGRMEDFPLWPNEEEMRSCGDVIIFRIFH